MSKFLGSRERCPIHNSYFCEPCHKPRKQKLSPERRRAMLPQDLPSHRSPAFKPAVLMVEDKDGTFREICNPREKRRRKFAHMLAQDNLCLICQEKFTNPNDVELCHRGSKGMGGAKTDDSMENTFAAHRWCNRQQGSMTLNKFLDRKKSESVKSEAWRKTA